MRMTVRRFVIVSALLLGTAPALAGPPTKGPAKPPVPSGSASGSASAGTGAAPGGSASASAGAGASATPSSTVSAGATQAANEIDTAARQLFLDASAAYEKGDNAKAYELLLAAWKVKEHWQIAASLGAAEMAVGKPVDAARHFTYYLREAPADRKEKATKLLAEATAKVGTITVTSEPSDATIAVDGVASGAKSGEPFYVTADERHVVTVRRGDQSTDLELIVGAGKSHEAKVVLEEKKRSIVLPAVAFGVGGAGLVLGVVTSVVAASKTSELRATCGQELVCPTRLRGEGDLAVAMAHTSTVGFVLAGAGAATGALLLLLPVSSTKNNQVAVVAGPAFLGLKGAF